MAHFGLFHQVTTPQVKDNPKNPLFATTRWSLLAAVDGRQVHTTCEALEEICRIYWFPIYTFVRRHGHSREEAEDLTQAFFVDLLDRKPWQHLDRNKGKFRAFLLAALKHFLSNARDSACCQKRGGSAFHLSLDWQEADARFQLADAAHSSPDQAYDREWAIRLLERVLERLQVEAQTEGTMDRFARLRDFLVAGSAEASQESVAETLGISPGAVRVAVHRLRKRYRQLLREEISQTLSSPEMVDEELRSLFASFQRQ